MTTNEITPDQSQKILLYESSNGLVLLSEINHRVRGILGNQGEYCRFTAFYPDIEKSLYSFDQLN